MKLSYRQGGWYAMPLGDGSLARVAIVGTHHHIVDIAAIDDKGTVVAALHVSDRALVLHRWKPVQSSFAVPAVAPQNKGWMSAAHAERVVARALGRLPWSEDYTDVRDLRNGDEPSGTIVTWRTPLDVPTLASVRAYLERYPQTALRPYLAAAGQLREVSTWPVRRLHLAALPHSRSVYATVDELWVEVPMEMRAVATLFPNVRALKIAGRGTLLDFGQLGPTVEALDCSDFGAIVGDAPLTLRALRLIRAGEIRAAVLPVALRTLAIEGCTMRSPAPVAAMENLEDVELRGCSHWDIGDVEPLLENRRIVRANVDIGGRRKNVELYKRVTWAYPWPFAFAMRRSARKGAGDISVAVP